ncbi:hypothetical protein [Deinococcus misasensis]|uniref:GAP1-N1 domain-containing protein n=1 Tax=Deinococcus misasensis TaxID=392413 RepID=UPI000ADE6C25|nr:hypothetical protein [Deinococcus misasensis]
MTFDLRQPIKIHQTLHGYSAGHKLLASSLDLPEFTKIQMLSMSDYNPSANKSLHRSILTGYPLKGVAAYALAKTWPDHRQKRPGCVWTHTLIIGFTEIARITSGLSLLPFFVPPSENSTMKHVEAPILLFQNTPYYKAFDQEKESTMIYADLIRSYCNTKSDSFIYENHENLDSSLLEELALKFWSQLWPRSRRSLTFRAGSFLIEEDNRHFDLMLPEQVHNNHLFNISMKTAESNDEIQWSTYASLDTLKPQPSNLSLFLRRYSLDVYDEKKALKELVKIFQYIHDSPHVSLESVLKYLSVIFEDKNEGTKLKEDLINGGNHKNIFGFSDFTILNALLSINDISFIQIDLTDIRHRAEKIWSTHKNSSIELINIAMSLRDNPLGIEIITGISMAISDKDIPFFSNLPKNLQTLLLQHNPRLTEFPMLWQSTQLENSEIFDIVEEYYSTMPTDVQKLFVNSILTADAVNLINDIYRLFGGLIIIWLLDWYSINKSNNILFVEKLKQLSILHPERIIEWLHGSQVINYDILYLVSKSIDPANSEFDKVPDLVWEDMYDHISINLNPSETTLRFAALIFSLAIKRKQMRDFKYIQRTMPILHKMAENDNLPFEIWRLIRDWLPSLGYHEWDKCEKIRRAVALFCNDADVKINDILNLEIGDKNLRLMIKYGENEKSTRKYFKRLIEFIKNTETVDKIRKKNLIP